MRKLVPINVAVWTTVLAVAGCGGSSKSSTTSPATTPAPATTPGGTGTSAVPVQADPSGSLAFTQTAATAKAGAIKIEFTNSASVPHNVTLTDSSGKNLGSTPTFAGGGTKALSVTLKPGTYTYYCSVPGHRQAGMQGTLTVS